MTKLAIIGASYLQEPLIQKAKQLGIETHVFAWRAQDVGEKSADVFYPISIVEKELILEKCLEIGIDGISSISSDLAAITVNYVAAHMGLIGNSLECTRNSTDKYWMRQCFQEHQDPSPKSVLLGKEDPEEAARRGLLPPFPVIVKPVDRSGSRGITRLEHPAGLREAVAFAREQGFSDRVLIEEYVEGDEFSVECISRRGQHHFLTITRKYTTGSPHFIERGHLQPAGLCAEMTDRIKAVVFHALTSLGVTDSASHSEVKIDPDGRIRIIEIGARMGGDCIGSDLVPLSCGVDFVRAVIDLSLGRDIDLRPAPCPGASAVRFLFGEEDLRVLETVKQEHPEILVRSQVEEDDGSAVLDSSQRRGYFLMASGSAGLLQRYLP